MTIKLFEVRDRATTLPCIGIALSQYESRSDRERWLLARAGYGDRCIMFGRLEGGSFHYDPYEHTGARTVSEAHKFVDREWETLKSGDVVDVEFILGETTEPKTTEMR